MYLKHFYYQHDSKKIFTEVLRKTVLMNTTLQQYVVRFSGFY